jgi:hypothetical protein
MSKLNTKTIVIIGVVVVILIAVVAEILVSTAEERHRRPPKPAAGKPHCKAMSFDARDGVQEHCAFIENEADCKSSKDPIVGGRDCQWVTG